MRLRRSEWTLAVYFLYSSALALLLPLRSPIPAVTVAVNAAVLAGLALLAWGESLAGREFFSIARDWYPLPLMLLAYREMGWFAPASHSHALERAFEGWDKALLNQWGLRAAVEALGPALPSLLEVAYSLVYAIPAFAVAMLYAYRRRERVNAFLFAFLLGILSCYALFPYFLSEPPRTVFPAQDFPSYETPFRRFNWWLLGGYGIHTSVFPSAHVAGAFSAALAMRRLLRERRWVARFLMALAVLIALATVYGRYHYAADALAGLGVSLVAQFVAARVERRSGLGVAL